MNMEIEKNCPRKTRIYGSFQTIYAEWNPGEVVLCYWHPKIFELSVVLG
jgi:hypothetical protein